jgi:hypothetical protein
MKRTYVPVYMFTFAHCGKYKTFGPYPDATEAAEGFQRVYGYWPSEVISMAPYESE